MSALRSSAAMRPASGRRDQFRESPAECAFGFPEGPLCLARASLVSSVTKTPRASAT